MQDSEIIELYFARKEEALRETDEKYGRLCYRIAYHILQSHEDSMECVNDTYMGIWNAIPPTRPHNFRAFVCKITRNLSLRRLEFLTRQKRAHQSTLPIDELAEVLPDESIKDTVGEQALGGLIGDFLRTEQEDKRNVFVRRYFFFDSIGEIAKRYSFTESKVKSMLYHTRIKLKDYLIKEGVAL